MRGELRFGDSWLVLSKPLAIWINDLWMAVFFLLVGLEIKRELLVGELASVRQAALPLVAALGGMVVPALIYATINRDDPVALRGWGIPMATDIAFALGVAALLGARVAPSLKVFLAAVAIFDDLGAIVVIGLFYTEDLSLPMLAAAGAGAALLLALNRARVTSIGPYVIVGLVVWTCVLKFGVHATLAGVVTALAIPLRDRAGGSPLARAEHALQPWVAVLVLPVFAFVNAGVSTQGRQRRDDAAGHPVRDCRGTRRRQGHRCVRRLVAPHPLLGHPAAHGRRMARTGGVALLCGIGFTMACSSADSRSAMARAVTPWCGSACSAVRSSRHCSGPPCFWRRTLEVRT